MRERVIRRKTYMLLDKSKFNKDYWVKCANKDVLQMAMRVWEHPVLGKFEGKKLRIHFDGKAIEAYENDSVAAALWVHGIKVFGFTEKYHEPRGIFCAIGLCTSCIMTIDGIQNVRTCITQARNGMKIESQVSK